MRTNISSTANNYDELDELITFTRKKHFLS